MEGDVYLFSINCLKSRFEIAICVSFRDSSTDLTMIIGAMYAAVLFVGINNCQTVQPIVSVERTVFYRERAAGMYSAFPYALAQVSYLTNLLVFSIISFALLLPHESLDILMLF